MIQVITNEGTFDLPKDISRLPPALAKTLFIRVFCELWNVRDNDRLLVIVSHGFIELLVNTLVDAKCKTPKKVPRNHAARLVVLHEMGVIGDFRFKSLDWFRDLRNEAAHKPLFEVTQAEMAIQLKQATGAELATERATFTANNTYELCMMLVITLWSDHSKIFSPAFFPQDAGDGAATILSN